MIRSTNSMPRYVRLSAVDARRLAVADRGVAVGFVICLLLFVAAAVFGVFFPEKPAWRLVVLLAVALAGVVLLPSLVAQWGIESRVVREARAVSDPSGTSASRD